MLAPRVFTATMFDRKPYNIDFVPVMIDGSEYYELKSKDFHYGYMTEALVNKIFETRPSSKDRYIDSFSFETKVKDHQQYLKLKNKIILDLPSQIDEANAFSFFSFYGVKYADDVKKEPIFIGTFFTVQNHGKLFDINVKSDFIECENFVVSNLTSTTLNIDLNNKSPYFGGIHLYGIENFQNPGGEINLHIKANSKNGYSSINIHQLTIDSEKIGDKNPLHIGFEFGDGVLNASGARINIQSSKKSTKKDYYMIGSATNGVDLGNSEITFLDGGSDKCSYLEARGLLHAYSSKLHIGGANKINGDLTYSGNERKKAVLILRNLTSYSNLNIKSSADGLFNFIDTTISNGKKIITIDERCNLINSSIENEGKKDLELFSPKIRHSILKNISSLGYVLISNSKIENLNLKCDNNNSSHALITYGPRNYCIYKDYAEGENTEILCSLKNTTIELGHEEFFNIRTENSVNISNSLIKGNTWIRVTPADNEDFTLSINNSLFNNLKMTLIKGDLDEMPHLAIENSELKGKINATGLESVEDSIIASSTLSNISKINGAMIEDKELDYNSYQHESDEPKKRDRPSN